MPIDTRFLNLAKDRIAAAKRSGVQFVKASPVSVTSAAAAMLLAPALLSNDNRDYSQTAAFTTPLLGAAAYATGTVRPGIAQKGMHVAGSARAHHEWRQTMHAAEVTYSDIKNAQKAYEDQKIALSMFQNMKRRFYAGRLRGPGNPTRENDSLMKMVDENLNTDSRIRYMSNSIHAERLRSLSAAEQAAYGKSFLKGGDEVASWANPGTNPIPKIAPILSAQEIKEIVNGQVKLNNRSFIRGLSSRIQRMDSLIDPGGSRVADKTASRFVQVEWANNSGLQQQVLRERPDLYKAISKSIGSGQINPSRLKVQVGMDPGSPILAFNYPIEGRRKGLSIPYVGENGAIETGGSSFGRRGVARKVYTADTWMKSDTYAFEALSLRFSPRQVREELKRSNMFGLVNSSEDFATYIDPEYGEYVTHNGAQKLRQYQGVPSDLFGFEGGKGFRSLDPGQKVEAIQDAAARHSLTKVGSEAGAYQGVLEEGHLNELSLNPSREKQNSVWRAETKGVRLGKSPYDTNPRTWTTVRDRLDPFFQTNKLQLEGVQDHAVSVRTAGITPAEQTLFGEMPDVSRSAEDLIQVELESMKSATATEKEAVRLRAYMESFAAAGRYDLHAISILQSEHKLNHADAKDAWKEIARFLSNPKNMKVMRKAGRVGEGEFLTDRNLYDARVERYVRYDVHEETMPDWDSFIGTSVEERFGAKKGQSVVLGRKNGNPVTAGGEQNFIENVFGMGDGMTGILVRETKSVGTGTKWNIGSQKGLQHAFEDSGDSDIFREGLNTLRSAVGDKGFIPQEANVFVSQVYNTNKSSELQDDLASIAGDTLRRVQEQGELDTVMSRWKQPMDDLGFVYRDDVGTLEWDVDSTRGFKMEERIQQQTQLLQEMLEDVGSRVRANQLKGDEFMRSYSTYANSGGTLNWIDYVNRYANPQTARVTDDMIWNSPKETKLAYYTVQQLVNRGQHGVASDLLDRLKYDGDPNMTKELQSYFNGDKTAISRSMPMDEALGGRTLTYINTAEQRANTIFDPGLDKAKDNFMMNMPDGSSVPVLGHEAYGGKVNRFGTGEFSASEHERALQNLIRLHQEGAEAPRIATQQAEYEQSLKKFLHGKDSLYRSGPVDPLAQTFRFGTRPSDLRYEDGSVNPFEVAIGRDSAAKIRDASIRQSLFQGDDVFMMGTREPVSHTPLFKVTIDDALNNSNIIGMDEGMRGLLMADADGDYIMAHFLRPNGTGHQEARDVVFGEDSIQRHSVRTQQKLVGVGDETRKLVGSKDGAYKPFTGRLANQKMYTIDEALRKRSTAGSIGSSSNTYSLMLAALEENKNITDPYLKDDFSTFFFQAIKQGPISAAKLKGAQDMDIVQALDIDAQLRQSMKEGGTYNNFQSALRRLANAADGEDAGAFHSFMNENEESLRAFHSGFDRESVNAAVEALTTPADKAYRAKRLGMSDQLFTYAQAASQTQEEARAAGAAGATASAETLGMINTIKTAAEGVGREARSSKLGIILGAGVAAAAIAGIAITHLDRPVASFGRDSSSRYRSEEHAPSRNEVPQDGPTGTRAPARPPRSVQQAPATTQTTTVAPIGETRDLDVHLRSKDQQRAHRTATLMARMATDGDSIVTINYRDQMKPKSLRTKERMRDALEG